MERNRQLIRWTIIILSLVIISLILMNTNALFNRLKEDQRAIMEDWRIAQTDIQATDNISDLTLHIIQKDSDIPTVMISSDGTISGRNVDLKRLREDARFRESVIADYSEQNEPIKMTYEGELLNTIYYGNSPLIQKLKYYPLLLLLIIILFAAVVYFFYNSSRISAQNKLWAGMAKETAHQIGTPLSSLIGWSALLRSEGVNNDYVDEIEKDVARLEMITQRFSKIGSIPELETMDLGGATQRAMDYLQSRSSKLIDFSVRVPDQKIPVQLNEPLYAWTIENIVKNGIDAMKGKGAIEVDVIPDGQRVRVLISDTGKGIPISQFKKIFEPGYTSKKRGWGLGLSLAKRIIEEYHHGKIRVLRSKINMGTTFEIILRQV